MTFLSVLMCKFCIVSNRINNLQNSWGVIQDHWVRFDGIQATREDLMMALSMLDYIMIKAEYAEETRDSRLQNLLHILRICDTIST